METYVLFLLLGLGAGAVYAFLGLGLVLEYKSSGVINFAQGALAMFVAYAYLGLRAEGELLLPVAGLPSRVGVFGGGLDIAPAFALALCYGGLLGLVVYLLIFRPLRHAPPLARLVASVGLMITLQALIVLDLGEEAFNISGQSAGNILPNEPVSVLGTFVPRDRFYLAGLTALIGLCLWALYRFSTFGIATRAAAETEKGAAVCGYSSTRLGAINWVIATALAGAAGILITPISGIEPMTFTLFIVPALGAALLGRLTSFSVTVLAGLTLGMLESLITKLTLEFDWLPQVGLQQGLPLLAIIVALVAFGRAIPWRDTLVERSMPVAGRPRHVVVATVLSLAAGTAALFLFGSTLRLGLIQSLITVIIGLSLVVVTGLAGQISLAQMAFAGFGGFMFGILAEDLGVPFPLSLLLAGLATAPLAVVVGLPSLRSRGVYLAVLTLAAAVALDAFLFSNTDFTGGAEGRRIPPATLFGLDLNIRGSSGSAFPRPAFGVLVLVVAVCAGLLVALLRRGPLGRQMLAIRANERAAAASGVSLWRTKLVAFAIAGFIAGLAGSLMGLLTGSLASSQFQVFTSLLVVALVYIGGVARISGAVVAGLFFVPEGFGPTLLDDWFGIGEYATLVGGLGLLITAILEPDGLSAGFERAIRWTGTHLRRPSGPSPGEADARRVVEKSAPAIGVRS